MLELPYRLVKDYLEKGEDAHVPGIRKGRSKNDIIKKLKGFSV